MQLSEIAQQMRGVLLEVDKGWAHRILFGGLHIVLERRGRQWRLAIGRTRAGPSATEIEVIARDFGVPPGALWARTFKERTRMVGGRSTIKDKFNVAECTWLEEGLPVEKEVEYVDA